MHVPSGADDGRGARARAALAAIGADVGRRARRARLGDALMVDRDATRRIRWSSATLEFLGGMASRGRVAAASRRCPRSRSPAGRTSASRRCSTARAAQGVRARQQHARAARARSILQGERRSSCSSTCPGYGYARISKEKQGGVAAADRGLPATQRPAARHRAAARRRATTRATMICRCWTSSAQLGVPTIVVADEDRQARERRARRRRVAAISARVRRWTTSR